MGSLITRGDFKIAISTNGKSPALSKRIREYLEEAIPETTQDILNNLAHIRNRLKGDFNRKRQVLNRITLNLSDRAIP